MKRSLAAALLPIAACCSVAAADAQNAPGVTDTEIRIGQTAPHTGPFSVLARTSKAEQAYFHQINDAGGIGGRKIILISRDDAYDPARTLETTRALVEQEHVALIFGSVGTATNLAVRKYLNDRQVPQLFIQASGDIAGDYQRYPWTISGRLPLRIEAQIYARYILTNVPDAKVGLLYQNDAFGAALLAGFKGIYGQDYRKHVAMEAGYDVGAATLDPQIAALRDAGVNVLVTTATGNFAIEAIAKVAAPGWHPLHFIADATISVPGVLRPAGLTKSTGLITATAYMDPTDPRWNTDGGDGGLERYNKMMQKYLPGEDRSDIYFVVGYTLAQAFVYLVSNCGDDLSRGNIMKEALRIKHFHPKGLLPGVSFATNPRKHNAIVEAALQRFDGQRWIVFGDVIAGQ